MYTLLGAMVFVVWGLLPIYFHQLGDYDPLLILAHRILWSGVILIIIGSIKTELIPSRHELTGKNIILAALAGMLMNISWLGFVYATVTGNLMAASLAFYITPILVFTFGFMLFREQVSRHQIISLVLMIIAVVVYGIVENKFPALSLLIALCFAMYLAVKKAMNLSTFSSIFLETIIFLPIALVYILYNEQTFHSNADFMLLVGTAPLQLLAVFMLTISLHKTPLSKISLFQYIEPTLHFMLAIYVFQESVSNGQRYALIIILAAIIIASMNWDKRKYAHD